MNKYEVVIAYRIYPKLSGSAYKLDGWDKYELGKVCLKSFLRCLSGVNFKMYAILDGCPPEYGALFRELIPADRLEITQFPGIGNYATFIEQIKVLLTQNESELTYFAEDDYFYLAKRFHEMIELIKNRSEVNFVTPYDHPDYYQDKPDPRKPSYLRSLHNYESKLIFEESHWRTASSTCCTFLTTKSTLMRTAECLRLYPKLGDYGMWLLLTKSGIPGRMSGRLLTSYKMYILVLKQLLMGKSRSGIPGRMSGRLLTSYKMYILALKQLLIGRSFRLWAPIPSIATHMAELYLSPGIDWAKEISQYSQYD